MDLIVGCGFLGSYLLRELIDCGAENIVYTRSSVPASEAFPFSRAAVCDLTSQQDILALKELCGGCRLRVFYLAACHNVDYLYENPQEGRRLNIDALQRFLALFSPQTDRLLFASTDCVYGEQGNKPPFTEQNRPEPINEYGRQKLEAEKIVASYGFTALRFPFMLGASLFEKKHFYDRITEKLRSGEPIEMIDGMYRSVLGYADAARLAAALMQFGGTLPPVVNVCGDRAYGKYDMGLVLARNLGADPSLVRALSEEQGKKFFKDRRASSALMDNTLLKSLLGMERIVWEEDRC
ncbi:MAG: NAD(P)-dependent oxidoreductase [Clostridia bacterium]|nr:NAD(P)-dependent oxidoreductase [Clostridia bacterium]